MSVVRHTDYWWLFCYVTPLMIPSSFGTVIISKYRPNGNQGAVASQDIAPKHTLNSNVCHKRIFQLPNRFEILRKAQQLSYRVLSNNDRATEMYVMGGWDVTRVHAKISFHIATAPDFWNLSFPLILGRMCWNVIWFWYHTRFHPEHHSNDVLWKYYHIFETHLEQLLWQDNLTSFLVL